MPTKTVVLGKKVPAFKKPATGETQIQLSKLKGQKVVLFFYPKDNTPGCTKEGEGFRDNYKKFKKLGTEIFGVSRDPIKSHERFKEKFNFPFELISDEDEDLCKTFDVIKQKNMYGKKFMGIERSTFVLDENG